MWGTRAVENEGIGRMDEWIRGITGKGVCVVFLLVYFLRSFNRRRRRRRKRRRRRNTNGTRPSS